MRALSISTLLLVVAVFVIFDAASGASVAEKSDRMSELLFAKQRLHRGKQRPPPPLPLHGKPTGNLTLVATGFQWAENLWFDGNGGLFVAESFKAYIVWKLTRPSGVGMASTKTKWLEGSKIGFTNVLGLHTVPGSKGLWMYAIVQLIAGGASVIRFSTTEPGVYSVYARTPALGNGIAVSSKTNTLFTTNEGNFKPGKGIVISVPNASAAFTSADDLWAADGAWLLENDFNNNSNNNLLLVSEVVEGKIVVFQVNPVTGVLTETATYKAPGCAMVDDFCVINNASAPWSTEKLFLAADWWNNRVVQFTIDNTTGVPVSGASTVLASGLRNPTSVRPGRGAGWEGFPRGSSVFVTEGGGVEFFTCKQNVWELHL